MKDARIIRRAKPAPKPSQPWPLVTTVGTLDGVLTVEKWPSPRPTNFYLNGHAISQRQAAGVIAAALVPDRRPDP